MYQLQTLPVTGVVRGVVVRGGRAARAAALLRPPGLGRPGRATSSSPPARRATSASPCPPLGRIDPCAGRSREVRTAASNGDNNYNYNKDNNNSNGCAAIQFTCERKVPYGAKLMLVGSSDAIGRWDLNYAVEMHWHEGDLWKCVVALGGEEVMYKFVIMYPHSEPQWEDTFDRRWSPNCATVLARFGEIGETTTQFAVQALPETSVPPQELALAVVPDEPAPQLAFVPNPVALELTEKNAVARTWIKKLEVVEAMLGWNREVTVDKLALSKCYLQWLLTGRVAVEELVVESASQERAEIAFLAASIFRNLEKVSGDKYNKSPLSEVEQLLVRQVQCSLPSVKPDEVQVGASALSSATLVDRLSMLKPSLDDTHHKILEEFLASFTEMNATIDECFLWMDCADKATDLRSILSSGLNAGMRNDAPNTAIWMRQQWRLGEISLEQFMHVLLIRTINALQMSAKRGFTPDWEGWVYAPWALALSLQHVKMTRWQADECIIVISELEQWAADENLGEVPQNALRMQATVERAMRITEDFASQVLGVYQPRSKELGLLLSLDEDFLEAYPNKLVRKSTLYIMAKLCALMRKATSAVAGNQGTDTVVPGMAVGTLVRMDRIDVSLIPEDVEAAILLVDRADGAEEITSDNAAIKGVVLCQQLPHLCRLAARARQENAVMATVLDEDRVSGFAELEGELVCLNAGPLGFTLMKTELTSALAMLEQQEQAGQKTDMVVVRSDDGRNRPEVTLMQENARSNAGASSYIDRILSSISVEQSSSPVASSAASKMAMEAYRSGSLSSLDAFQDAQKQVEALTLALPPGTASDLVLHPRGTLIDLSMPEAPLEVGDGGSEAMGISRLLGLADRQRGNTNSLRVPKTVCLPFSTLEWALRDAGGDTHNQFYELVNLAETYEGDQLNQVCGSLQVLLSKLQLPETLLENIARTLTGVQHTTIRPSANVEGLNEIGMYTTEMSVNITDREALRKAIADVWSSLFSRQAVINRRAFKVPQSAAAMAIIMQELVAADTSFILHTSNMDGDRAYVELAVGLSTPLIGAGTPGSPWCLSMEKRVQGRVQVEAYANFSTALTVGDDGVVTTSLVDYSAQPLSTDPQACVNLGQRLTIVSRLLEGSLEGAQEVEGAIVGDELYILRTRPLPF
mmetsp:Transcript_34823/g.65560  ORF Transcript_34823/g.65560 Transcript_34823/m.65560 type:complete len:1151 (+) Transcript_34823:115-3567(+)